MRKTVPPFFVAIALALAGCGGPSAAEFCGQLEDVESDEEMSQLADLEAPGEISDAWDVLVDSAESGDESEEAMNAWSEVFAYCESTWESESPSPS